MSLRVRSGTRVPSSPPCRVSRASQRSSEVWSRAGTSMMDSRRKLLVPLLCPKVYIEYSLSYTPPAWSSPPHTHTHTHTHTHWYSEPKVTFWPIYCEN